MRCLRWSPVVRIYTAPYFTLFLYLRWDYYVVMVAVCDFIHVRVQKCPGIRYHVKSESSAL